MRPTDRERANACRYPWRLNQLRDFGERERTLADLLQLAGHEPADVERAGRPRSPTTSTSCATTSAGTASRHPSRGPYSFDDLIGDVVGLWDHLGISKSHFVGLSIGGDDRAGAPAQPFRPGHGHGHGEHLCAQRRGVHRRLRPARRGGRGRRHGGGRRVDHRALVLRGLPGKRRSADRRCAAHDPHDLGRRDTRAARAPSKRSRISTGWARSTIPSC